RVGQKPKRRQEDRPARELPVNLPRPRRAHVRVPPDERDVRHTVYDDIRHRKSVVRVERDDADVPTHGSRRYNDVLPRTPLAAHDPRVQRAREVSAERETIKWKRDSLNPEGKLREVARQEPPEAPRQVRV